MSSAPASQKRPQLFVTSRDEERAQQGARANGPRRHASCFHRSRAAPGRGSSLTLAKNMSPDIVALWISGASLVLQAVSMIPRDSKKRTPQDEAALRAVSEAYYATHAFYAPDSGAKRISKWDLAMKWEHAARLLRDYDPSLAERLHAKSEFWHRGGTWSDEAIQKAGIGLESIKKAVDERLTKNA